jgi:Spy/CpxP family protein refolding chaperone
MKLKLLAGMLATAVITITPLATKAQEQAPQTPQNRPRIELNQEQQLQLEQIQNQTLRQIDTVLTPEQRGQFNAGRQNGQGIGAIQELSENQRTQLRTILQRANSQVEQLLTPEQIQQIQQQSPPGQ